MNCIRKHFEWIFLALSLIVMSLIDPYTVSRSLCLFENLGVPFCPGHGLGHSIAFFFRGEFAASFQANLMGPAAVLILTARVLTIWKNLLRKVDTKFTEGSFLNADVD